MFFFIYLQKNIRNIDDEIVEVEEKRINIKEKSKCKTYDIMILYIILMIYNKKIILEVQEESNFFYKN